MFSMMKESQKLPIRVKAWMGLMMMTFMAHLFFLDSTLHQISLATFMVTLMVFAPITFSLTKNVNSLAATHFVTWPIALAYGIYQIFVAQSVNLATISGQVLLAGYAIFAISLVLDYRILLKELTVSQLTKSQRQSL